MTLPQSITLTDQEIEWADRIAKIRNDEAQGRNYKPKHGLKPGNELKTHRDGARGELALSKFLGVKWDATVNTFKRGGDVGKFQVRTTKDHDRRLIIRHDDRDEDIFWLVTGESPHFIIQGWIECHRAR